MKKHYKHLAVLGTLCCVAALAVLWLAVLTVDWVSIQEPQLDPLELDKLGPYEEPRPHLIRAKFGLFKMCYQQQHSLTLPPKSSIGAVDSLVHGVTSANTGAGGHGQTHHPNSNPFGGLGLGSSSMGPVECIDLDWYNFGVINFGPTMRKPPQMPTELSANLVEKLRFTLPFIGLSVLFTSISFLCLTFGYFCQKNKKIIEASLLILAGLCQATALLTFVSQIGSEFEANLPYSHHHKRLTTFYRYKYGYSFYLFLLSFSLSELAALFDMAAYFRKYPPNHYVITFHRQEPSPFLGGHGGGGGGGSLTSVSGVASTTNNANHVIQHTPLTSSSYHPTHTHTHAHTDSVSSLSRSNHHHNHIHQNNSQSYNNSLSNNSNSNTNTYPSNYNAHLLQHGLHHHHHTYSQNYNNPSSAAGGTQSGSNSAATTLTSRSHVGAGVAPPDLCNDYIMNTNDQMIDLTLHHGHGGAGAQTASLRHHSTMRMTNGNGGGNSNGMDGGENGVGVGSDGVGVAVSTMPLPPPQSFMNPEVTITTIERNNGYGTLTNNRKPPGGGGGNTMESFGTMRKENNI